jgi:glycosyltransferase involved in cell wall biosynthesis
MDLDDVPSTFLRTVWEHGATLGGRLRAGIQMLVAKRRERLLGERFKLLAVCSEADQRYLGIAGKVHVIPNGFARPVIEPARQVANPPRIGFIGKFGYPPNDEGIRWFAEECWPRIKREVPDARLRVIGKGGDRVFKPGSPDIDILGWVEEPAMEIATWAVTVVPLWMGAGTRVKIAEAFSRKCPIVSTSFGAYGYDATNGREMFLADSAGEFANDCVQAIRKPAEAEAMAERAWQHFLEKWTWQAIRPRIWATAEECLRQNAAN